LVGGLSEYISEQPKLAKHGNPGNHVVTITINEVSIGNTLIDLGAAINVMAATTLEQLQLQPLLGTIMINLLHTTLKPMVK
jgi:hypothetical protein